MLITRELCEAIVRKFISEASGPPLFNSRDKFYDAADKAKDLQTRIKYGKDNNLIPHTQLSKPRQKALANSAKIEDRDNEAMGIQSRQDGDDESYANEMRTRIGNG